MEHRIFGHTGLGGFLTDFVERKRAATRNWSLGVWARDLKLTNVATLTRVVNGERNIGPALAEKFCDYFGFDAREAEYFRHLIVAQKHAPGTPLRELAEARLLEMRQAVQKAGIAEPQALFFGRSDRSLTLWGTIDIAAANALLRSDGLEMIDNRNEGLCGIQLGSFYDGTFGPFAFGLFAVLCKRIGAQLDRGGFQYRFQYTDNHQVKTQGVMTWGNVMRPAAVAMTMGKRFPIEAALIGDDKPIATLRMAEALAVAEGEASEPYVWGISNQPHYLCRSLSRIKTFGFKRLFDRAHDVCEIGPSPLADFCVAAKWRPYSWASYTRNDVETFGPSEL
jgi:hypothetical protein